MNAESNAPEKSSIKLPKSQSEAIALYNGNLEFFRAEMPKAYEKLKDWKLSHLTLNFEKNGNIDVYDNRSSEWVYKGNALAWAEIETSNYIESADNKPYLTTVPPHDMYVDPRYRYASQHLTKFYDDCPQYTKNNRYRNPSFISCALMMGVGLGLHVQALMSKREIQCLVLHETDIEFMVASLYITDWKAICRSFMSFGKSFSLNLGSPKNERSRYGAYWNSIYYYVPDFPYTMYYYNHRGLEVNKKAIKKIQFNAQAHIGTWGYYDDEVNQLNNAYRNLKGGYQTLKRPDSSLFEFAAIVGSGPSLDRRIEDLKSLIGKVPIISCGTALKSLHAYGIKPDFHIELESNTPTYDVLMDIPSSYLSEIDLIAAAQVNPKIPPLFKTCKLFFKDSTALLSIFGDGEDCVEKATPTCTNTGMGLCIYWRVKNVFLFGIDFGFKDKDKHHANNSIYYDVEKVKKIGIDAGIKNLRTIKDINGNEIWTKPTYFTALVSFSDACYAITKLDGATVYNCSEGADIESSKPISSSEFSNKTKDLTTSLENFLPPLKKAKSHDDLSSSILHFENSISEICKTILDQINIESEKSVNQTFLEIHAVSRYLERILKKYGSVHFFIRGSVWHYLSAGLAMILKSRTGEEQTETITRWKLYFSDFISNIPDHLATIKFRSEKDIDPWIEYGIKTKEGGEAIETEILKIDFGS